MRSIVFITTVIIAAPASAQTLSPPRADQIGSDGYVMVPGARVDSRCVHYLPSGTTITTEAQAALPACPSSELTDVSAMPARSASPNPRTLRASAGAQPIPGCYLGHWAFAPFYAPGPPAELGGVVEQVAARPTPDWISNFSTGVGRQFSYPQVRAEQQLFYYSTLTNYGPDGVECTGDEEMLRPSLHYQGGSLNRWTLETWYRNSAGQWFAVQPVAIPEPQWLSGSAPVRLTATMFTHGCDNALNGECPWQIAACCADGNPACGGACAVDIVLGRSRSALYPFRSVEGANLMVDQVQACNQAVPSMLFREIKVRAGATNTLFQPAWKKYAFENPMCDFRSFLTDELSPERPPELFVSPGTIYLASSALPPAVQSAPALTGPTLLALWGCLAGGGMVLVRRRRGRR